VKDEKIVCPCMGITVGDIRKAVSNGAADFNDVSEMIGISSVCGRCRDYAENVVNAVLDGE
jgi:bacterioferritin-associated ferredoxin